MRQYKYRFTTIAQEDLGSIWGYSFEKWGESQADKYIEMLFDKIREILHFPEIGRKRNELIKNCRSFTAGKHIIFYRVKENEVEILRLLHTRCEVPKFFQ